MDNQSSNLTIWSDPQGKPYIVLKEGSSTKFTPLEEAIAPLLQQQVITRSSPVTTITPATSQTHQAQQRDWLPYALVGLGVIALIGIGGYVLGFTAGNRGRETVVIPRSPVCDTTRSSFLFWSSERKECQ
ncbi:MAG: hypothetical protein ACKO24_08075 [Leptolyngbyaceae cyanobacterium]